MESSAIKNLEHLLTQGQDSAMLRFGLGSAHLKDGNAERAVEHLAQAVILDPHYSAAWKLYGKALVKAGEDERAAQVYDEGIAVAEAKGDVQAAKEMRIFRKRLLK